jgi:hypothetical protein
MSNISLGIRNHPQSLTLAANDYKTVDVSGSYFLLVSNSLTTDVEVAIGGYDSLNPWPVLFSAQTRNPDEFFDKVRFHNPAGVSMTIEFWVSTLLIDNKSAEVTGTITIPIDDTSNGTVSDASIVVQSRAGYLLTVGPVVNVGGGVVGLPLTAHPFVAGDLVTVTGCPQYNGAYTVLAGGGVNQVNITHAYMGGLLDNAAAVNVGGGVVGIPITGHSYTAGETIRLAGTVNYNGDEVVVAGGGANQVNITAAYVAEVFTGAETHNLVVDGVDDTIALTAAQSIASSATQKELHIANHDATYKVFWGDSAVNAATYRGVPIAPESVYIIPCTDVIYLAAEAGAGVAGCRVSWNRKTKS